MAIPPDLVGDNFDFFQDQTELAMDSRGEYRTHWFLGGRQSTRQSAQQDLDPRRVVTGHLTKDREDRRIASYVKTAQF